MIDEDCLEEKYGGKLPNITGCVFPPNLSKPHVPVEQTVPIKWKKMVSQEEIKENDVEQEVEKEQVVENEEE